MPKASNSQHHLQFIVQNGTTNQRLSEKVQVEQPPNMYS